MEYFQQTLQSRYLSVVEVEQQSSPIGGRLRLIPIKIRYLRDASNGSILPLNNRYGALRSFFARLAASHDNGVVRGEPQRERYDRTAAQCQKFGKINRADSFQWVRRDGK